MLSNVSLHGVSLHGGSRGRFNTVASEAEIGVMWLQQPKSLSICAEKDRDSPS